MSRELVCKTCEIAKPETDFWRDKRRPLGRQSECKSCMRSRTTNWFRNNRERHRENNKIFTRQRRRRDPRGALLVSVRWQAKAAGREFALTLDDIVFPEFCPILGIRLEIGTGIGEGRGRRDHRPSIDRIDNSRGYTPDNIVIVSYRANRIKSDATIEELTKIAKWYGDLQNGRHRKGEAPGHRSAGKSSKPENAMSEVLAH